MMRSYVCYQCRSRLSQRIARARNPQWQRRATFISLRNSQPSLNSDPNHEHIPTEEAVRETKRQNGGERSPVVRSNKSAGEDAEHPRAGRYSRRAQNPDTYQTIHLKLPSQDAGRETAESSTPAPLQSTSLSCAQAIDRCLRQKDVKQAWGLFLKNYSSRESSAFTNPSFGDVPFLNGGKIFAQLADAMLTQYCNGADVPATPTDVLFRYEQLGIARQEVWRKIIVDLTDQVLWSVSGTRGKKRDTESLVSELVSLWRLFFQCQGQEAGSVESIAPEWLNLPDIQSLTGLHREINFGDRLQHYHPRSVSSPPLQFSAITLFNLFDDVNQETFKVSDLLREQIAPFIRLLTYLLAGSHVGSAFKHTQVSQAFKALPDDFRKAVMAQISSAPQRAMTIRGSQSAAEQVRVDAAEPEPTEAEKALNLEEFFLKRISRAVQSQAHVGLLEKLWTEVLQAYKSNDQVSIPSRIYNAFLSGYMSLYQAKHTVEVWNHMIAHGVKPDTQTWCAMLEGCVRASDLNGLNAVWDRMLKSGVEPDNYAWTTRVHGLMTLRQINLAFNALDEMGKKWLSAENVIKNPPQQGRGNKKLPSNTRLVNSFTKPSIEVINGAISALVQISNQRLRFERKVAFMQKILQWAGSFDVKPDARTYNILIQLYLGVGDYTNTFKLLRQMEQEGIEGDLATHTMLIRAAFDNQKFSDLTESEQTDQILKIFSELEAGGLKLNAYVYSSTIDRLLKHYGNYSAVKAVMDHMMSRDLVPSPQIYTSLITHYFQSKPPNIAAVDSLVMQIFGPPRAPTDKYLFDRIIEGYARNGEVGKMMSVLARMGSHGKLPGWQALTAVVKALVEAGDWERARLVVRDVQMGEGVAKGGVTGGMRGQQIFFNTVKMLGSGLTETLAGDYLQSPVKTEDAHQHTEALKNAGLEGTVDPAAQEKFAQTQGMDDEFVNAEHASYLSNETEEHQQQWTPQSNGAVGGVPL